MWILLALIALAILGPLFGADSRDGLDWRSGHFWLRSRPHRPGVRNPGSRGREDVAPAAAVPNRPVPAAW
jgi:hypothetical protein